MSPTGIAPTGADRCRLLRWLLPAWVALLLLAPPGAHAAAGAPQSRFAVVIGSNLGAPDEEPLRFAERDASRFADVLTRFANVPADNLVLLRGRDAGTVQSALQRLGRRIAAESAAGRESVLFIYYSGHADPQALHLGASRFSFSALKRAVEATEARLSVLVVDACRSGELTRVKGARPARPFQIRADDKLASEGTAIITSSAAGEDAQESDRLGGGVFSHHFINGLLGAADQTRDQRVSLSEAYRYAYNETLRTTSRAPVVQHPTFAFRMRGREDLVVTRLTESAGLGRLRLEAPGTWMLLSEGGGEAAVSEVRAERPTEVLVDPGGYLVRRRTADAIFEGRARVEPGALATVAATQLERVPYGMTVRKGYDANRRSAWGGVSEAEVAAPFRDGLGAIGFVSVGGRADFEALALELRLRFGQSNARAHSVGFTQQQLGADLGALRLFDLGRFAAGFGLRVGADWIQQRFDTTGQAPDRNALAGRAGALLRLEYAPLWWLSVRLSGGLDAYMVPVSSGTDFDAAPFGGLGMTFYVL